MHSSVSLLALIMFYVHNPCVFYEVAIRLEQLCPTRGPRAAYGPVEGFVRPSLSLR